MFPRVQPSADNCDCEEKRKREGTCNNKGWRMRKAREEGLEGEEGEEEEKGTQFIVRARVSYLL
jgi:hypothetical protein